LILQAIERQGFDLAPCDVVALVHPQNAAALLILHKREESVVLLHDGPEEEIGFGVDRGPRPAFALLLDRLKLEYLAFVPSPPAWEIAWDKPVAVDTLVAYEAPDHPQAVPQEVRVDAWVDGNWKEVAHAYWNDKAVHGHRFEPMTTTKLRYVPVGDLAKGVYLGEIEVYHSKGK
jgi:hypothetical protein